MSFALIVYLIGMLDKIDNSLEILFWIAICVSVVGGIAIISNHEGASCGDESAAKAYKIGASCAKTSALIMAFCLFFSTLLPSKETAYTMLAASGVESIVTDERVQQLGGKSLDVIEQWLDEMSPENEGE